MRLSSAQHTTSCAPVPMRRLRHRALPHLVGGHDVRRSRGRALSQHPLVHGLPPRCATTFTAAARCAAARRIVADTLTRPSARPCCRPASSRRPLGARRRLFGWRGRPSAALQPRPRADRASIGRCFTSNIRSSQEFLVTRGSNALRCERRPAGRRRSRHGCWSW